MSEPLALSTAQQFDLERMSRAIEQTHDPKVLQGIAKQLLQAWQSQKAATQWVIRQHLGAASRVTPDTMAPKLQNAQAAADQIAMLNRLAQEGPQNPEDPEGGLAMA